MEHFYRSVFLDVWAAGVTLTVNLFTTGARPRKAVIIFPMLARGLFRVCQWSATQVLVFHFVGELPSVPRSSYLTCQLVNKQPGWFSVFLYSASAAVTHNKLRFLNMCKWGLVRCKPLHFSNNRSKCWFNYSSSLADSPRTQHML